MPGSTFSITNLLILILKTTTYATTVIKRVSGSDASRFCMRNIKIKISKLANRNRPLIFNVQNEMQCGQFRFLVVVAYAVDVVNSHGIWIIFSVVLKNIMQFLYKTSTVCN